MGDSFASAYRTAFEALGYRRWAGISPFLPNDIWYRYQNENSDTFHVAYFGYQSNSKSYGIQLGAFNTEQLKILENSLLTITKYQRKSMAPIEFSTLLCWMLFVPNRGPYLNLLSIPDPLARSSWPSQLQDLKNNFLEPVFWQVKTPDDIQNLLLSNEFPYEWKVGHPVLRVAQILALAKVMNVSIDDTCKRIAPFKDIILAKMQNAKSVEDMIGDLGAHIFGES